MKLKILSLILSAVLLLNSLFALSSCSILNQDSDTDGETDDDGRTDEKDDTDGDGNTDTPGGDTSDGDKEPDFDDWFGDGDAEPIGFRVSEDKLEETLKKTLAQIEVCIESYDGKFPSAYSTDNVYKQSGNTAGWVQGFWTGALWHAFELSGNVGYRDLALTHVDSFKHRIDNKLGVDNHDLGFLYTPSCVAAYKLTGDETAREAAILAADQLMTRYHSDAGFIQAWGTMGDDAEYRLIIDCLLNLPILYWASEETGDSKYRDAAVSHFEKTLMTVYREDGSTFHTYYFDPETKEPAYGKTKQGAADDSAWSRGQAWGMYGPLLTYKYTGDERALDAFKAAADYFIDNLPADRVPYWDFIFERSDGEPRDSSAAAIAVCALLESAKYLDECDPDKAKYTNFAHIIMNELIDHYQAADTEGTNGILLKVTQSGHTAKSHEEMTPYGDYFFIEALHRMLDPEWELYW